MPDAPSGQLPDNRGPILFMVMLAIAGLITVAGGPRPDAGRRARGPGNAGVDAVRRAWRQPSERPKPRKPKPDKPSEQPDPSSSPDDAASARPAQLPGGGTRIFGNRRFLVAYYGTARTGALGVLGETGPSGCIGR